MVLVLEWFVCYSMSLSVIQIVQSANVAQAETLFDDILKEDADLARLRLLPGVQHIVDEYVLGSRRLCAELACNDHSFHRPSARHS